MEDYINVTKGYCYRKKCVTFCYIDILPDNNTPDINSLISFIKKLREYGNTIGTLFAYIHIANP